MGLFLKRPVPQVDDVALWSTVLEFGRKKDLSFLVLLARQSKSRATAQPGLLR